MTSNELRTYWPLNLRFTEGDIRLGEQLLESSDLFLHNGLRLLYNVNLRDLSRSPMTGCPTVCWIIWSVKATPCSLPST